MVLEHPQTNPWLKAALRGATQCHPVEVQNDLEILNLLLRAYVAEGLAPRGVVDRWTLLLRPRRGRAPCWRPQSQCRQAPSGEFTHRQIVNKLWRIWGNIVRNTAIRAWQQICIATEPPKMLEAKEQDNAQ